MNEHTLAKLEFDRIREVLAGHCSCSLGKVLSRRIVPSTSATEVRRWIGQVREMNTAVETGLGLPPMGGVRDIRVHLPQAGTPAGLEADALADIAETLAATGPVRAWLEALGDEAPSLRRFGERIGDFTVPAASISEAIDARGKVRDEASPKLATIRATIEKARKQITVVIDRLLRQTRVLRLLQYPNPTFHNDRTVLPLKAEHRGRIPGIIHRSSDSGATLYVEPAEAVELNNTIVRLRQEEHKEITRILQVLSRLVHENAGGIQRTLAAIGVLDLVVAKYRYGRHRGCLCPDVRDDGVLYLQQARHPVLVEVFDAEGGSGGDNGEPHGVVPIDVRLGDDFDLLVVTGPNTGGKTVTLKTVGLIALMAQSGIPIPVGPGTEVPVFRNVFIDVGDEQSLQQSLSTFSGHMANILSILQRAGKGSLVLLDELGAGTDPDEGAALGRAVIDEILRLGAKAVVSTHLSALKGVAYTHPRIDNAAVEFDVESLRPTYALRLGEPGNSNAIVVAERLGMSGHTAERARRHLSDQHRHLQQAIEGTLQSRRQAEAARQAALKAKLEADRSRERYEDQRDKLSEQREEYRQWVEWINRLTRGDRVYVRSFEKNATVVRVHLHKQTALVSAGAMDYEVQLRELSAAHEGDDADG
ncbi:MAG TPA: DNA strand exchange inhibitor protein [Phycisphaerae bacterium]|nr:DNA strand exchange inhibitor protein [Phycisphaerae bacterium]